MASNNLIMLAVAPNGASRSRQDHPALPITVPELALAARECMEAGACMIHLHVRDSDGNHTLSPDLYLQATDAIRDEVGDGLVIQITSESAGIFEPEQQMAAVSAVMPEAVSLSLKEFCGTSEEERPASEFFHHLYESGVYIQYILFDLLDIMRFKDMWMRGMIPGHCHSILLVLGRYSISRKSHPSDINPLTQALPDSSYWSVCAFGPNEHACMTRAAEMGGHCRVGFENNFHLPDGEVASSNAQLIEQTAATIALSDRHQRRLATAEEARRLLRATLPEPAVSNA